MTNLEKDGEKIAMLARYAFGQADALCSSEHKCTPYHKSWSYLRLFERRARFRLETRSTNKS